MKKRLFSAWILMILVMATLGGVAQSFISPAFTFDTKPPVANLLSPDGGQVVPSALPLTVAWTATDDNLKPNPITILLIIQPGNTQYTLAQDIANTGTASVNLPAITTTQAKIKIVAKDMFGNEGVDESTSNFSIGDTVNVVVQGTVKDSVTLAGISGAVLTLTGQSQNYSATSQLTGNYSLPSVFPGYYNLSVTKNEYLSSSQYVTITSPGPQTIDVILTPEPKDSIVINSSLTAFADNISEDPANFFTLTGNVNINHILYFSGAVKIDMRSYLVKPEINGSGQIFSRNIAGFIGDYPLKTSYFSYVYKITDNNLEPKTYAGIIEGAPMMGGFKLTIGKFIIDPGGDFVECKTIAQMPYPIDKIMEEIQKAHPDDISFFVSEMAGSIVLSKTLGVNRNANVSVNGINLGLVKVEELTLSFNTFEDRYGGSIMLKIPGIAAGDNPDLQDSLTGFPDTIPVEIRDTNGDSVTQTTLGAFTEMQDFFGLDYLSLGFEIEFLQGSINKLIVTLGAKIPLFSTGLFITEMTGGVDELASEDWKVLANVDIETGLELPVLGSPVKIDDMGAVIHPWNYFKLAGSLKIFEQTASDASIVYDHKLRALQAQCNMNLLDIYKGDYKFSIQGGNISGSSMLSLQTPDDLPFGLSWAENIRIGSSLVEFHNLTMQSQVNLGLISLAQRVTFGKQGFPWFHYALGPNLKNLIQIWKGQRNGKQTITFEVPENASELMVVASDTINPQLFDFSLISPSGKIFDSTNTAYQKFPSSMQTVMVVKTPADGQWQCITPYTGDVALYLATPNKKPVGMVNAPGSKQTLSNEVSLSFNDYADTIRVKVYYDTDRKDFNGSFINEFRVVNNANLTFDWQNEGIPDGEYFIYTRVDDGVNTPALQYAPGSILIANHTGIETPQSFAVAQQGDSLLVSWSEPTQPDIYGTTVFYMDISTQFTEEASVYDSLGLVLKGLLPGHGYRIWGRFVDEQGNYGPETARLNLIFVAASANNPPYFTSDRDSAFVFITGESTSFTLLAADHDGNPLTFSVPGDTLGLMIAGNQLTWMPTEAEKGVYTIVVVVSDGQATDTTWQKLIVYTPEDLDIGIEFSSVRLYEQDNMFVTIRNYFCPDDEQTVTLTNLTSGIQSMVTCSRVNEFDYIGQFELTFTRSIAIAVANGDSLRASYTWGAKEFNAYAYYDSLPQPGDHTPPATISDLTVERLRSNKLKLSWTATGNDSLTGKAFRYDIRYSGQPIANQSSYFTANQILTLPYPAESGETDTLIVDLANLLVGASSDSVYFSIKASDEMQNWSGLSNNPGLIRLMEPENITARLTDQVNITLDWEGPGTTPPNTGGFQYYRLFRAINNGDLLPYMTGITTTTFTDMLQDYPDGIYHYALQAVYEAGMSDTILAEPFQLKRFVNVNILAELQWANSYEGVTVHLAGLDTIFAQSFIRTTGSNGLVLLGNVFRSTYTIQLARSGYDTITDTLHIHSDPETLQFLLPRFVPTTATVQNLTLTPGHDTCFQAKQSITVGGSGTTVTVQNGVFANFIAGQKINFLPTFKALPGSNLHAYITPNGQYCAAVAAAPENATLQNLTFGSGQDGCFDALNTLTLAGNGTAFTVGNGAVIDLVAGQKILFRPTVKVLPGGYLHARIAPNGPFCSTYKEQPEAPVNSAEGLFFKVYPNPTKGVFTLAFTSEPETSFSTVMVYNLFGKLVAERHIESVTPAQFSLRDQTPGLYLIRVQNGDRSGTLKIVKQ